MNRPLLPQPRVALCLLSRRARGEPSSGGVSVGGLATGVSGREAAPTLSASPREWSVASACGEGGPRQDATASEDFTRENFTCQVVPGPASHYSREGSTPLSLGALDGA